MLIKWPMNCFDKNYIYVNNHDNFLIMSFRSEASGNCLYSSASIALCGDNSLYDDLRLMTTCELFLNHKFYLQHPLFTRAFDYHKDKSLFLCKIYCLCLFDNTI